MNICISCDNHKNHKRINFIDILLNEVKNKMNIYYKINEDIINNYDNKHRNYETLYYLNHFKIIISLMN